MKDVEAILMRYREVEARIALLEVRLAEQEHLIRSFRSGSVPAAAIDEKRMLGSALDTLRTRRRDLMSELALVSSRGLSDDPPPRE